MTQATRTPTDASPGGEWGRSHAGRQSDEAVDLIGQAILRCELTPGALVSEAELAARFGLRRAATRVALERLSVIRMLRPVPRRGYVVKPITLRDVHDLFRLNFLCAPLAVVGNFAEVDAVAQHRK